MAKTNKQIINALIEDSSLEMQNIVPLATSETGAEVLSVLNQFPTYKNMFISDLVNKVAMSIIESKGWRNPLSVFAKGRLPLGSTIEQIFVSDAKRKAFGSHFDGSTSNEGDIFSKVLPQVYTKYITVNYMNKYKVSISEDQLRLAFVSQNGLSNLVAQLINSVYEQAEVDDYEYTKYCLYDLVGSSAVTGSNNIVDSFVLNGSETEPFKASDLLTKLRAMSGRLNFKSTKYNVAGVKTFSKRENLVLLVTPEMNAVLDVQGLATLFNIDRGSLNYRVIEVDELPKFTTTYTPPMGDALVNQETGSPITQTPYEIDATLQNVQIDAIVADESVFQMWETLVTTRSMENINDLSTNIILHKQGIAGSNPYANFICYGHKTV